MKRERRLRTNEDFQRVRRIGRSWAHPLIVLFAARGAEGEPRVGITVSKRVGGAVVRNRLKRQIGEAVRSRYEALAPGWDLVFLVRPAAAGEPFDRIDEAVGGLLRRGGVWLETARIESHKA